MSLDKLPFNMFDLVLVAVLLTGLHRGRKIGMSGGLISILAWLALVLGCALSYEIIGQLFASTTGIFSMLASYIIAYVGAAIVILLIFASIKRSFGGRLTGSDVFGGAEYYLGMGGGVVRAACMLLAVLALLNARYYNPMEVRAMEKFQNDVYGSNFFPTVHSVQSTVFEKSLLGPYIRTYLSFLLIKPTPADDAGIKRPEAVY